MASKKKKAPKKTKQQPGKPGTTVFLGPEPGGVTSVAALGTNVLACTESGELFLLNRSEDGKLTWFTVPNPTSKDRMNRA